MLAIQPSGAHDEDSSRSGIMKYICWAAVVVMSIMPLNYSRMVAAKLVHGESFGAEDVIGFGVAAFGALMAITIYRTALRQRSTGKKTASIRRIE
jgi:hypothetical protein